MSIFPDPVKTKEEVAKEQVTEINTLANRIVGTSKSETLQKESKKWHKKV